MAGAHWTYPRNVETRRTPIGETGAPPERGNPAPPTERTGGSLDEPLRPAPPTERTGGGLIPPAASAALGFALGFSRDLDDFANRGGIVHRENPAPIVPEPQPLADGVAPHYGRYRLDGIRGGGGIEAGGGARFRERVAAPCVQFAGGFDDHAGIIRCRRRQRKAAAPVRGNPRRPRARKPAPSADARRPFPRPSKPRPWKPVIFVMFTFPCFPTLDATDLDATMLVWA